MWRSSHCRVAVPITYSVVACSRNSDVRCLTCCNWLHVSANTLWCSAASVHRVPLKVGMVANVRHLKPEHLTKCVEGLNDGIGQERFVSADVFDEDVVAVTKRRVGRCESVFRLGPVAAIQRPR